MTFLDMLFFMKNDIFLELHHTTTLRLKAISIKSSLSSFLKASSEYEVISENSCSESKSCYLKQIIHLHMNLA